MSIYFSKHNRISWIRHFRFGLFQMFNWFRHHFIALYSTCFENETVLRVLFEECGSDPAHVF